MSADDRWRTSFAGATTDAMRAYDDVLVPRLFEPWAAVLLDRVAPRAGEAVLDVATGPGTVARLAAVRVGPGGRVTGIDLSPALLAIAAAKPPLPGAAPVEYAECGADALAVPDAAYDVVVCQQGLQFFPDRPAALREMRRAARPGARLGVAVWRAVEESPFFAALATAVTEVLGPDAGRTYRGGPWGLTDGATLGALVADAGFTRVEVESRTLTVELGPDQLAPALTCSAVAPLVAALDDAARAGLAARAARALAPFTGADGVVRTETTAHVVVARA